MQIQDQYRYKSITMLTHAQWADRTYHWMEYLLIKSGFRRAIKNNAVRFTTGDLT